jgi:hypothetical protein
MTQKIKYRDDVDKQMFPWMTRELIIAVLISVPAAFVACVHGGDKTGHWSVGDVLMRAV